MHDGAIVFSTELDNKDLERQLAKAKKEIEKLEQAIWDHEGKKSPLVQQAQELEVRIRSARQEVQKYGREWEAGIAGADKNQSAAIAAAQLLEAQYAKTVAQIDKLDEKLTPAYAKLDGMKESAGALEQQLVASSGGASALAPAVSKAEKRMSQFITRIKGLARRVFVFTLITAGLRAMRDWMGKVIQTDGEATAAIGRLKAALLVLVQPIMDIVIPAFTTLVDLLSDVVMMTAQIVSSMFGMTIDQSKEAAEGLYEETEALEETEEAAEEASKSLAAFDEINQLSGTDSKKEEGGGKDDKSISPDFGALDKNDEWLAEIMERVTAWVPVAILLGGIALVAIGAATGNLFLVAAGLLLLGQAVSVSESNGELQSWVDALGLNSVMEFVLIAVMLGGIAMVAIGAATGNILLVIAGLLIIWGVILYANASGIMNSWTEEQVSKAASFITAALILGGIALVAIGAAMGNILMVVAGLALIAAGVYVGIESGTLQAWAEVLGLKTVFDYVTSALILAGIVFIAIGAAMGNALMVVAGLALVTVGAVAQAVGEETLKSWWEVLKLTEIQQWVSVALMLVGVALIAIGAAMGNILMVIGGAVMLGLGVIIAAQNDLKDWVTVLGLEKVAGWVTAALMLAGIAFIVIGAMSVNFLMIIAGIALFGTGIIIGNSTGTFKSWVESLGLEEVPGWVSTALQLAGMALIAIGAITLNPLLIIAGLGLLGAGFVLKSVTGSSGAFGGGQASFPSGAGRSALPPISSYEIPALAQGAVIPPNREFLAVLGDQKSGTNVEAPISTIKEAAEEAVENVMSRNGLGGPVEVRLVVSYRAGAARYLKAELDKESARRGTRLVEGNF